MNSTENLFTIGEIAKAPGVTRRIILHYEERGLIRPDARDAATGNRLYSIDTFTQLRSIRSLQNLGLTPDEIRDYFSGSADLTPLIRRLEKMRDELNLNIERLYERSKTASTQIKTLRLPERCGTPILRARPSTRTPQSSSRRSACRSRKAAIQNKRGRFTNCVKKRQSGPWSA